jgi:hypothetical protein
MDDERFCCIMSSCVICSVHGTGRGERWLGWARSMCGSCKITVEAHDV